MNIFVGRSKEREAADKLLHNKKGIALIVGETGIGKSRFLAEVYHSYRHSADFLTVQHVCRFSDDVSGPFVSLLASLVFEAVATESRHFDTKSRSLVKTGLVLTRLGQTFGFSHDFVLRLLGEVSLKLGPLEIKAEKVFRIASETWQRTSEMKPGLGLAKQMLSEHAPSFTQSYIEIIGALQHDLPSRKLLLILDQAERAQKTTLDMLIDFAEAQLDGIHMMLAFTEETSSSIGQTETPYPNLLYLESNVRRLDGHVIRLHGLTTEEIGDWVERTKKKRPTSIELRHIQKITGGLPLLIEESLAHKHFDLGHIEALSKREYLDQCYEQRLRSLEQGALDFACRLSVLREPLSLEDYLILLELGRKKVTLSDFDYLQKQLEVNLIFGNDGWFRHETIKDYLERRMLPPLYKQYHIFAARFFELRWKELLDFSRKKQLKTGATSSGAWISPLLSQSYHSLCAGQGVQGLLSNKEVFDQFFLMPWYETFVRQQSLEDVSAAIPTLEKLYDYFKDCDDTLNEAKVLLWLGRVKDRESQFYPRRSSAETKLLAEARQLYDSSLMLAKPLRDKELLGQIFESLAFIEWKCENYDGAIGLMRKSLKYRPKPHACKSLDEIHQTWENARCLDILSQLAYERKDIGIASRYCRRYLRLMVQVKNAETELEKTDSFPTIFQYASGIFYGLHMLGQIYEEQRDYRKATIIYGLLYSYSPDFKWLKDSKTITELMNGIRERVGEKRFNRYQRELTELGFVADEDMGASVYRTLDIVNERLLGNS